eukprot:TRINITY_DN54994_c0_g1_i1.p1 TRINITY_DN54994_c0_g1~~TRINITY_DN54994_c0_g1_i1.p1  ORF type:complete len:525 (+),score=125.32 TRINITY_DN54994_c0_g1_i1:108-1682(+)
MRFVLIAAGMTPSYATKAVAGRYCAPTDSVMLTQMSSAMSGDRAGDIMTKVAELPNHWLSLLVAMVLALILGYVYLHALDWCAGPMVCACLLILVAIPLCVGGYIVWVTKFEGGVEGIPAVAIGSEQQTFYAGCGCLGLGAVLACIVCCSIGSMETAIGLIKTACDCINAMPSMLLVPLIDVLTKAALMIVMFAGLLQLMSCGDVTSTGGMLKQFSFTAVEYGYLAFYVFMMIWVSELVTSFSQFVVAYAGQAWYFTPYKNGSKSGAPSCAIFTGYLLAGSAHVGSLLLGSFLIATLRFIRMCLEQVVRQSKASGNCVLEVIGSIMACIVACFERVVEFVNKTAYIEIAINGTAFCPSAQTAIAVMVKEAGATAILHGATFVLQFAGVGAIAFGTGAITMQIVQRISPFNDPASEHFVSDPMFVAGVATLCGAVIGVAFMIVFDTVADTMLFCFAADAKKSKAEASASASGAASKKAAGDRASCGVSFLSCGSSKKPTDALQPSKAEKDDCTPPALRSLLAEHR